MAVGFIIIFALRTPTQEYTSKNSDQVRKYNRFIPNVIRGFNIGSLSINMFSWNGVSIGWDSTWGLGLGLGGDFLCINFNDKWVFIST